MPDIRLDIASALTLEHTGFVSVVRPAGFTFEYKNGKDRHSFIFADAGELQYEFPTISQSFRLRTGQVLFVPEKLPYHATYLQNGTAIKMLIFSALSSASVPFLQTPRVITSAEAGGAFECLDHPSVDDTLLLCAKVYELLHILQVKNTDVPKKYRAVLPAVGRIRRRFEENCPVGEYAAMCTMSESNFRRLFLEYTGQSPVGYRNALRIAEAQKLLASGEFSVSEIAESVGFNNMAFFYECLHKYGRK